MVTWSPLSLFPPSIISPTPVSRLRMNNESDPLGRTVGAIGNRYAKSDDESEEVKPKKRGPKKKAKLKVAKAPEAKSKRASPRQVRFKGWTCSRCGAHFKAEGGAT